MNRNSVCILLAGLCIVLLSMMVSCGPSVKPTAELETAKLPPEEQDSLAMVDFEEILDLTIEKGKRNVIPEMEAAYKDIIRKYPKSYVAQESYWRLVELNLKDQFPPKMERAEDYREEFLQKYPDSRMIYPIDDSMARYYYRNHEWQRLVDVLSIHIREFIKTDKLTGPLFMFYYAEAKYNLKDFVEARKGYRIVADRYPSSLEARVSRQRIDAINAAEKKTEE